MVDTKLLELVVPQEDGWYVVMGLAKDKKTVQTFHKTLEEVRVQAEDLVSRSYNTFFGCGKFKTNFDREAKNCGWMQSFFLDIDCGPEKASPDKYGRVQGYVDQATGFQAVKDLCRALKLPRPTTVDSGRGWHVYWPLTEPVEIEKWLPVAHTFKARCAELKIIVDPAVPADAARILRIPGTLNFKEDPPIDVLLMHETTPITFQAFADLMGPLVPTKPVHVTKQLDDFTKAVIGNKQSRFKKIFDRTLEGDGCDQLRYLMENQESVEEPLWRAGLSIAKHCVDGDKAIHIISKRHPRYDKADTERKAHNIKGPYTCDTFNDFRPNVCANCTHWKQIKSPIVLGHEIAKAEENEVLQEGQAEFVVPTLPHGYFRGQNGGIYLNFKKKPSKAKQDAAGDEEEEDTVICVYRYDLFVTKRLHDPIHGETLLVRRTLPRDGFKEFPITVVDTLSKDEFKKVMAFHGVIELPDKMQHVLNYIVACAKELQVIQEVETMRLQFGWTDDDDKFILGTREIGASYIRYSPPSKATGDVANALRPVGDLDTWKRIFNVYDLPGFEPHAFAAFTAFGAPLVKFMGIKGGIINLINNKSGTGKSTILQVMNSVWGHPDELMLQWRDTMNVKMHRLAVMCNLPLGVDEITKMSGDEFSDLAYSVTQGAPRRRMKAASNEERMAEGFWATMMVCTSNSSMIDKLQALKSTSEGELMRLMQYKIEATNNLDKREAKHMFGKLQSNYGLAGAPYAQYLVQNLEEVIDSAMKIQSSFDTLANVETRERFWSATVAANITGGMIAHKLGLHDINTKRVFDWAVSQVGDMQVETQLSMDDYAAVIGEFLLKYNANILVINHNSTSRSGIAAAPIVNPRGAIIARYEPDTHRILILRNPLREFCVDRQVVLNDMLAALNKEGSFLGVARTRMEAGTDMKAPPVEVLEFDSDKLGIAPEVAVPTDEN